jgi:hypothetical protein
VIQRSILSELLAVPFDSGEAKAAAAALSPFTVVIKRFVY